MGKVTTRFVLGGPAPTPEGAAYFRIDGKPVVVSRDFAQDITRHADVYREKTIVPYLSVALDALEVQSGIRVLKLKRMDDIAFRIEGSGLRASRTTIDRLWLALADLRAESFVSVEEATALTREPAFRIHMSPIDKRTPEGEMLLGGPCPGHPDRVVFLRKLPSPIGACVPRVALENLGIEGEALADNGLFSMRPDEVEEFSSSASLERGKGPRVDLARKGSGFRLRAPEDRDLTPPEVETFSRVLVELFKVQGTRVAPPKLGSPLFVIAARRSQGAREETVEVFAEGGQVYAKRAADGAVLTVPPTLVSIAFPGPEAYRAPSVWDLGPGPNSLALDCGTPQELALTGGLWGAAGKTRFVVDHARVLELVDILRRLRADLWFHGAVPSEGHCGLTVGFAGRPAAHLSVGPQVLPGYVVAQVDGAPFFAAPEELSRALRRIYLDRVFIPDDAPIVSAQRKKDGAQTDLFGDAGEETAAALLALRTLRADEVHHLGAARPGEGFDKAMAAGGTAIEWTVRLGRDAGERDVRLSVGARKDNMYYARYGHADATFLIDATRLAPLLGTPASPGAADASRPDAFPSPAPTAPTAATAPSGRP
jgi:hypothetical protein